MNFYPVVKLRLKKFAPAGLPKFYYWVLLPGMTQKEALEILKLGHNVYLTGSAGSGKTFLLNEYIGFLKNNNAAVGITASTGIAATHMNGVTIHSWSGLGIKDSLPDKELNKLLKKRHLPKRFRETKVLIIDEVSMLHHFRLDLVDKVCKTFKQDPRPFGGIQTILCGDFFQLPPISKYGTEAHFINKSEIWDNMSLKVCYLHEQHRHNDGTLTEILNDIRTGRAGEQTLIPLRKRYQKDPDGHITPTKLYTHNADVEVINIRELDKIQDKAKTYDMSYRGPNALVEALKRSCLAPENLALKKGAVVMFVKNNFVAGYVNGTLGKVIGFDYEDMPIVETFNGKRIVATPESWRIEEDNKTKVEISQIPLRLAWAITVHKSQGMSLDAAEIDLSKSFVEGMGYVALSRLRTLEGLKLMGLNKIALQVNKEVLELDNELIEASEITAAELRSLAVPEREKKQKEFLSSIASKNKQDEQISTYEKTKLLIEQKLSIAEIAKRREMTRGTIVGHLEKLIKREENLDLNHLRSAIPDERFQKIKTAFEKTEDTKLSPVREVLGDDFSYDELRLARLFLNQDK